jgi:hypothetical protein
MINRLFILFVIILFSSCSDDDVSCIPLNAPVQVADELNDNITITLDSEIEWENALISTNINSGTILVSPVNPLEIKYEIISNQNFDFTSLTLNTVSTISGELGISSETILTENEYSEISISPLNFYSFGYVMKPIERDCDYLIQIKYSFKSNNDIEVRYVDIKAKQ